MRIFVLYVFSLLSVLLVQGQQSYKKNLVDQWSFEDVMPPEENQANTDSSPTLIGAREKVSYRFGLAIIDNESEGRMTFDCQTLKSNEYTIWLRLKFDALNSGMRVGELLDFAEIGMVKLAMLVQKDRNGKLTMGLSARTTEGNRFVPGMGAGVSLGSWIQVAILKEMYHGKNRLKIYYREENSAKSKTMINWVYLGASILNSESATSIRLGHVSAGKSINFPLLLDEVRSYSAELDNLALLRLFPSLEGFEDYPKEPFGTIIDYSPAATGKYIAGSPSVVKLKNGTYLAKGDDYGPAVGISELARIYRSVDKGNTWEEISQVEGITWATLFTHREYVYMLGTSAGHGLGHVVIMKSDDGGVNWTAPTNSKNGLLKSDLSYHTAPVPVIIHKGRIWRAMEDEKGNGGWGRNFRAMVMSASIDSDLLDADSWAFSEPIGYNGTWLGGLFNGILEGNIAVAPNGEIVNLLRVSITKGGGKAAYVSYGKTGMKPTFNPDDDFIDFPGGSTKFHVLYDSLSRNYISLSNAVLEKHKNSEMGESTIRNALVLMSSTDLREWKVVDTVLYHPDVTKHGFQYPSFIFDDEDIIFVSRTAYDDGVGGAYRQHDVNYFTFHRIKQFRRYLTDNN